MMHNPQHHLQQTMAQRKESPFKGLRIATITLGAFGFLLWSSAIGFSLGYCFYYGLTSCGAIILILVNAAYNYYTSRIIFCITAEDFPNPQALRDARKSVSRLVAAIFIGFAVFVTATVWIIIYDAFNDESFVTLFGCSFSFLWTIIVVSLAGVHETKCSRLLAGQLAASPTMQAAEIPSQHDVYSSPGSKSLSSAIGLPRSFSPYPAHPPPGHHTYTNPLSSAHGETPM